MQSFKYDLNRPAPSPRRRRPLLAGWLALAVFAGAGAYGLRESWPVLPSAGSWVSWLVERPAVAGEGKKAADQLVKQGDSHLSRAEYRAAMRLYGDALKLDPTRLEAWDRAHVARFLHHEGTPVSTAELVPDALARGRVLASLAGRELTQGRAGAARELLQEAGRLAPDDVAIALAQVEFARAQGDLAQAGAILERALTRTPEDPSLIIARFELRLQRGETEPACQEALVALRPFLEADPSGRAASAYAEAYVHQGLAPDEVRRRVAQVTPQLGTAARKLVLAGAYQRHYVSNPNWHRDSFERVRELVDEVRRPDSDASAAERLRSVNILLASRKARVERFLERSDVEAALQETERCLSLAAALPTGERARVADLHAERGRLLTLLGRPEPAMKAMDAAVRTQPGHKARFELARLEAGIGVTLLSAGQKKAATQHFRRAASLHPEDDGLLARFYQSLGPRGSLKDVLVCARVVREREVGTVFARLTHGLSQAHRPVEAAAVVALAKSTRLSVGRMAELRAEAARAAGKTPEARKYLLQAIEHVPSAALWLRLASVDIAAAHGPKLSGVDRRRHLVHALDETRHALAMEPDGPARGQAVRLMRELAVQHLRAGDLARAEHFGAAALGLAPSDPGVALVLADARLGLSRWDAARDACQAGLGGVVKASEPLHAALRLRHGRALRKLDRLPAAITELAAGLADSASPSPALAADLWYELAFAHAAADQREEALNAARQYAVASSQDPQRSRRASEVKKLELTLAPTP